MTMYLGGQAWRSTYIDCTGLSFSLVQILENALFVAVSICYARVEGEDE